MGLDARWIHLVELNRQTPRTNQNNSDTIRRRIRGVMEPPVIRGRYFDFPDNIKPSVPNNENVTFYFLRTEIILVRPMCYD